MPFYVLISNHTLVNISGTAKHHNGFLEEQWAELVLIIYGKSLNLHMAIHSSIKFPHVHMLNPFYWEVLLNLMDWVFKLLEHFLCIEKVVFFGTSVNSHLKTANCELLSLGKHKRWPNVYCQRRWSKLKHRQKKLFRHECVRKSWKKNFNEVFIFTDGIQKFHWQQLFGFPLFFASVFLLLMFMRIVSISSFTKINHCIKYKE